VGTAVMGLPGGTPQPLSFSRQLYISLHRIDMHGNALCLRRILRYLHYLRKTGFRFLHARHIEPVVVGRLTLPS
jgi:hypothetical protein